MESSRFAASPRTRVAEARSRRKHCARNRLRDEFEFAPLHYDALMDMARHDQFCARLDQRLESA